MIDLRAASNARSVAEFVDRALEAVVAATGATITAFIDERQARRYAGRAFWTEPRPTIDFFPALRVGQSSDFDAPWPDRPTDLYALVPLRERGAGMFGWLYILGGSWRGQTLEQYALSLAPIAQVVRDYADAYKLAMYDTLTGLPNEALYTSTAAEMLAEKADLTIVFIDLNDFKQINDTRGHDEGDKALKIVAHALAGAITPIDFVARLHGDEFVALLRVTPPDAFLVNVRSEIGQYGLTLSAGYANAAGLTVDEARRRADEEMYKDKAAHKARTGSYR